MITIFCPNCETYIPPAQAACPACDWTRPATPPVRPAWTARLEGVPAGPPLQAGPYLLAPTHNAGGPPQQATLHWLNPADGATARPPLHLEAGCLISGLSVIDVGPSSGQPETLLLVTTYSADPLGRQGGALAFDLEGREIWRWRPGVQAVSAPAIAGEMVWATTNTGTLAGLALAAGVEQHRFDLSRTPAPAAPTLSAGAAYIPGRGPYLLAVGLDGQQRWQYQAEENRAWLDKRPLVLGERIIAVLNLGGAAAALRREDGGQIWQVPLGPPRRPLSPPVAGGERLYVGSQSGLHALDPADGREIWHAPLERGLKAAPVVVGGVIYAASLDRHLYAFEATGGRELWRYAVERRLEHPPLVTTGPEPLAIVFDRGGDVTALERPLSLAEAEAAGRWVEAAAVAVALDQPAYAAELLQDHGEPLKAAQIWLEAGQPEVAAELLQNHGEPRQAAQIWLEAGRPETAADLLQNQGEPRQAAQIWLEVGRPETAADLLQDQGEPRQAAQIWLEAGRLEAAAGQYEAAGDWTEAIDLWARLDRPQRRAEALEKQARALAGQEVGDDARAEAWETAAQTFAALDLNDRATVCRAEVARYRRLPVLTVDIEHKPLALQAWTRLRFIVHNTGHGPARRLIIRARGGQFEGSVTETRRITTLRAGQTREDHLDIRPLAHGDSVPLRVSIDYQDRTETGHTWQTTLYLPVAQTRLHKRETTTLLTPESAGDFAGGRAGSYNLRQVRALLNAVFSEDDLRDFCLYEAGFRPVHDNLKDSDRKADILRRLIDYARQKGLVARLLDEVKKKNPARYEQYKNDK